MHESQNNSAAWKKPKAEKKKKKYILCNPIENSKTWKPICSDRADRWFTGDGMGGRWHEQTFGGPGGAHASDGNSGFQARVS